MGTPIRVSVVTAYPLWHDGLVRVLREESTLKVSPAMVPCATLATSLTASPADVVLLHIPSPLSPAAWRDIAMLSLHTKVLAVLRCWNRDLVRRAARLGIVGFVTEDVQRDAIVKALHEVASGRGWSESRTLSVSSDSTAPTPSAREQEVLALVRRGLSNRAIADQLCICERTVKSHVNRLLQKFQVKNRVQLALCSDEFQNADMRP
jgi:DNA-binding NarL/FixJ family response regulator